MSCELPEFEIDALSPAKEIVAYEYLWTKFPTVKKISDFFRKHNHISPSLLTDVLGVNSETLLELRQKLDRLYSFDCFTALFFRDFEYPNRLREAEHPVEVLYSRGNLDLLSSKSVSIVGARNASSAGIKRAAKLARMMVENDFTVMSGLAAGIDKVAHQAAIEAGGQTIAVLGTSLDEYYPKENRILQDRIIKDFLVVSQVPFYQSKNIPFKQKRWFFPERNKTMSALSEATIIVEAGETSGTLTQARAALKQGRKLFILDSCFNSGLDWPDRFLKKGAIKVVDGSEIVETLGYESRG